MFRFTAPITMGNASASLVACVEAIDRGETEIGLEALDRSDSSAVAVLLAIARHIGNSGKAVTWSGMPAPVASLARLYGVDSMLGLVGRTVPAAAPS